MLGVQAGDPRLVLEKCLKVAERAVGVGHLAGLVGFSRQDNLALVESVDDFRSRKRRHFDGALDACNHCQRRRRRGGRQDHVTEKEK